MKAVNYNSVFVNLSLKTKNIIKFYNSLAWRVYISLNVINTSFPSLQVFN